MNYKDDVKTPAQDWWSTAHTKMRSADDHYRAEATFPVETPTNARKVEPPLAADIIHTLIQHVPPDVQIEGLPEPPTRGDMPTDDAIKKADKRESWVQGAFDDDAQTAFRMGLQPLVPSLFFFLALRGLGVLQTYENTSGYEPVKLPAEKKKAFDIRHRKWEKSHLFPYPTLALDPLCFSATPDSEYVVIETTRWLSEVRKEFDRFGWDTEKLPERKSKDEQGAYTAIWSEDECVYLWEDLEVWKVKHNYGFIPFVWAYSGLGSYSMFSNGTDGPHNMAVGLIGRQENALMSLYLNRTMREHMFHTQAYAQMMKRTGTKIPSSPWEDIEVEDNVEWPRVLLRPDKVGELSAIIAQDENDIRQMTTPAILGGVGLPKQATASESLGALAEARLVMGPLINAAQYMIEVAAEHKLRLLERRSLEQDNKGKAELYVQRRTAGNASNQYRSVVRAASLSANDVDGFYAVKATIKPITPQEDALRTQIELQKLNNPQPIQSKATTAHNLGITDWPKEQDKMFDELVDDGLVAGEAQMIAAELAGTWQGDKAQAQQGDLENNLKNLSSGMLGSPNVAPPGSPQEAAQTLGQTGLPQGM